VYLSLQKNQRIVATGTKAILMASGVQDDGYVPINQTSSYCWSADLTPSFVLKAVKVTGGKPCSDPSYANQYKQVSNDYVAYFLQKQTATGHLGGTNRTLQKDLADSKKLCDLLGVSSCPAAQRK
jgi:hypothetical protein